MVKAYKFLFTLSLAITLFLLVIIVLLNKKQVELNQNEIKQYESFKLSEELRISSDDLTRYCRTYVITGDPIWEKKFWKVLAIRNGEIPRPDGKTISLKDSMVKIGFSDKEMKLFNLSEANSNNLVNTEIAAFNAVKGIFRDSLGNFTVKKEPDPEWAKKILFDDQYHVAKKAIMSPIHQFNDHVDKRTVADIKKIKKEVGLLTYVLIILIISLIAFLIFFLVLIQNKIQEQRQYERDLKSAKKKAEESDEFKSVFLANMSHEIRTPLNAIIGFANQLTTFYENDTIYQKYIRIVKNSGEHLLNLINDVLEISKIEANQLTITQSPFYINELMNEIYEMFLEYKSNLEKNDVELVLKKDEEYDLIISSDETKLRQVLTNLVNNAIKFTFEGFIEIGYEVNQKEKEILFYVKDTGVGIPDKQKETIFKRFLQSDQTIDENEKGTGLGLEISQAIIHALGGEIWVESEINIGSTFYFTIPLVEVEGLSKKDAKEKKNVKLSPKKILIAEDSDVNFLLLKLYLTDGNHEIIRVTNGIDAIEKMREGHDIELILMDVRMPKLNGWEAIKEIRTFNTIVPIIVQTANSFDSDLEESMKVGATDFISKPIMKEELLKKLNKVF
ncbi:histidine kinase [Flavobacteriaceae bacterium UJ101]|nr:histidine kinase [Flavobacteriaceae bacterium UJ101]